MLYTRDGYLLRGLCHKAVTSVSFVKELIEFTTRLDSFGTEDAHGKMDVV